jgi:malate dehydrogenase (oxaloacetate-decarboxylating)(NADP+)
MGTLGSSCFYILGLGLGAILTRATAVTDTMVEASSLGLANALTAEEHSMGLLYPRIERSKAILFPVP